MSGRVESWLTVSDGRVRWRIIGDRGDSPNDTGQRGRGGTWRATMRDRQAARERWRVLLLTAHGRNESRPLWPVPEFGELVVREWPRNRDLDNIAASVKYLLDALVWDGWLVDDRFLRRLIVERPGPAPGWANGPAVELVLGDAVKIDSMRAKSR